MGIQIDGTFFRWTGIVWVYEKIRFKLQSSSPPAPPSGYIDFYNSGNEIKYKKSDGTERNLGSGSGHTIRENGTDQTARTGFNFVDADAGAGLITDDAINDETEINLNLYILKSLLTTQGDLIYRNASAPARLAIGGTAGLFLRSDGTDPSWTADVAARTDASNNRFRHLNMMAKVFRSADKSITSGVVTVVDWDVEDFDNHAMHDNATNNSRISAPIAGKYMAVIAINWDTASATGVRFCSINKNAAGTYSNATVVGGASFVAQGSAAVLNNQHGIAIVDMAAGDYIEAFVYQTSGGNLNIFGSSDPRSYLSLVYIGE